MRYDSIHKPHKQNKTLFSTPAGESGPDPQITESADMGSTDMGGLCKRKSIIAKTTLKIDME